MRAKSGAPTGRCWQKCISAIANRWRVVSWSVACRFDRELLFPLPNLTARRAILDIHTRAWSPAPSKPLLDDLAGRCVGYCGADLKALCVEAALAALRRRYPQIYDSEAKLQVGAGRQADRSNRERGGCMSGAARLAVAGEACGCRETGQASWQPSRRRSTRPTWRWGRATSTTRWPPSHQPRTDLR